MREFRLLGPFEVAVDGEPVAIAGEKPRALLARLLLDAGRVVSADTLVDGLWGDRPPASARKVTQVYVSQLRKALGADAIETRPPGYVLRARPDEVDLGRFEALAEEAREAPDPARRADLLRRALGLWRGAALEEFRHEPFARAASQRFAELRLAALGRRIDAELELGRHEELVDELAALVDEEPLREGPRRQLMLALYRAGRQADALAAYREGRHLLVEQLGIEPSPALQELERAILGHDAALDDPAARPSPRGSVVCVGAHLAGLLAPLGRDLVVVELATDAADLGERSVRLRSTEGARTAAFTSRAPAADLARLAIEQDADLLVVTELYDGLLQAAPCDVALAPRSDLVFAPGGPVLVPFGGGREEWAALELGAWLARAHGLPLSLLGTTLAEGSRDASRILASASLALQRFVGTAADPVLVLPGAEGILAEPGSLLVASLPAANLDGTRRALVERTTAPILLVHAGLRPSGLAPDRTLTRFSWSLDSQL
ncbi:MAG TPA: AfsR/SARP family transcriptional regulator [Gaiellaceae bacterium]